MATPIVPDGRSPTSELMDSYADILAKFKNRMSLHQAEEYYDLTHAELRAAIDDGKCRFYKRGSRYQVCHEFIAEYIERYCTFQNKPLPS